MCRDANLSSDMINHIRNREELIGTGFGAYRVTFRRTTTSLLLIESPIKSEQSHWSRPIALVGTTEPSNRGGEGGDSNSITKFFINVSNAYTTRITTYAPGFLKLTRTVGTCEQISTLVTYVSYLVEGGRGGAREGTGE